MPVPFIDLVAQYKGMRLEILQEVRKVFDSQQFILKSRVERFEAEIARYIGAKYAIGVASGTDALYLSLAALGIGAGDEVITTPFTFFATAGAISHTRAKPVFADVDADTWNIDPQEIAKKVTARTKAILPVHLFGLSCQMNAIRAIARRHSLFVIEDAAQSFGAQYEGKKTAAIGDAGALSFFPTKNMSGAGDGGMVVTSSKTVAKKIRMLRVHGSRKKYHHELIGINSRLDELQAAVLLVKLKYIDTWNRLRQKHAADYDEGLAGLPLKTPVCPKKDSHSYHLYTVLTPKRDALEAFLTDRKIGTGIYYPLPLHLQPCYETLGYHKGDFPISERLSQEALSLPMYPELSAGAKSTVTKAVRGFFAGDR